METINRTPIGGSSMRWPDLTQREKREHWERVKDDVPDDSFREYNNRRERNPESIA